MKKPKKTKRKHPEKLTMTPKFRNRVKDFLAEYLKDLNAARAAAAVGYAPECAKQQGVRILARKDVREYLNRALRKRRERVGIESDAVLEEIAKIAFSDIADAFTDDGCLLPIRKMPEGIRKSISSIEVDEIYEKKGEERILKGYTRKIKLWSKDKSLENCMRHLGMFAKDNEQAGKAFAEILAPIIK
jgi:phage terminase small subunit